MLSPRFDLALTCASDWHRDQKRKGSGIPYVSHLLGVTALVLEHGGDENTAIAALLHDAVEDAGGAARLVEIDERFGADVARFVDECSEEYSTRKPPWRARKEHYIARLSTVSPEALLISGCDKLHNLRTIIADVRVSGPTVWRHFNGGYEGSLWYYQTILAAYRLRELQSPLLEELDRAVLTLTQLARPG
jgi:(p)ppGpp synthase/HD superfamily hydrolase